MNTDMRDQIVLDRIKMAGDKGYLPNLMENRSLKRLMQQGRICHPPGNMLRFVLVKPTKEGG